MQLRFRTILLFLFITALGFNPMSSYGQSIDTIDTNNNLVETESPTIEMDSIILFPPPLVYEHRNFNDSLLNAIKSKPQFQYCLYGVEKIRLQKKAGLGPERWVKDDNTCDTTTQSIQKKNFAPGLGLNGNWLLIGVIAIILVIFILQASGFRLNSFKNRKLTKDEHINDDTDIHSISFDAELDQALLQQNYNKALRLRYLQLLKYLDDRKLITWEKNKTNWDYVAQIENKSFLPAFKNITYAFDYINYGQIVINKETYDTLNNSIKEAMYTI